MERPYTYKAFKGPFQQVQIVGSLGWPTIGALKTIFPSADQSLRRDLENIESSVFGKCCANLDEYYDVPNERS